MFVLKIILMIFLAFATFYLAFAGICEYSKGNLNRATWYAFVCGVNLTAILSPVLLDVL